MYSFQIDQYLSSRKHGQVGNLLSNSLGRNLVTYHEKEIWFVNVIRNFVCID